MTAIGSVVLAVTNTQGVNLGFSTITTGDVQLHFREERHATAPRFGRPMFVPIVGVLNHTVLAVAQLDKDNALTVSVLDSQTKHYTMEARGEIFRRVMATVQHSHWWRHQFASWEDVSKPDAARWIPCAQQPGNDECGYYTILNTWALALGLELNPHSAPVWDASAQGTRNLYQTVLDIAHLARLGEVNWKLIHDFLRCYGFVMDGDVPEDRQFARTVALESGTALRLSLQDLNEGEALYWSHESKNLNEIKGSNFILLLQGVNHDTKFPDDAQWSNTNMMNKANGLAARGHIHFGTS